VKKMETKRVRIDPHNIDSSSLKEAAELLRQGQLVALPTETVYGLGASALNPQACKRIFEVKGRPQDNPLIVHISDLAMAQKLVTNWSPQAEACAAKFWPGPLTLVLEKTSLVPEVVSGGLKTVAIRMPKHPVALELIRLAGVPVAAPSANLSGKPSPISGEHVWKDLKGKIPLILDSGSCAVGVESTVLDLTGEIPTILRPGGITKEELEEVLGEVGVDKPSGHQAPKAPGMKYRHYAPEGKLTIYEGDIENVVAVINREARKKMEAGFGTGIIATDETKNLYLCGMVKSVGSRKDETSIAAGLYNVLREFDEAHIEYIYSESFDDNSLGQAIMNRLLKAAGYCVVRV